MRTPRKLIQQVLLAVANVEGWDANRPSIKCLADGDWLMEEGLPVPSYKLLAELRKIQKETK